MSHSLDPVSVVHLLQNCAREVNLLPLTLPNIVLEEAVVYVSAVRKKNSTAVLLVVLPGSPVLVTGAVYHLAMAVHLVVRKVARVVIPVRPSELSKPVLQIVLELSCVLGTVGEQKHPLAVDVVLGKVPLIHTPGLVIVGSDSASFRVLPLPDVNVLGVLVKVDAMTSRVIEHEMPVIKVSILKVVPPQTMLLPSPPLADVTCIVGAHEHSETLVVAFAPLARVLALIRVDGHALAAPFVLAEVTLVFEPIGIHLNSEPLGVALVTVPDESVAVALLKLSDSVVLAVDEVSIVNVPVR
mmetsp:Transcript_4187/g.7826  ORF Transcript_4187/g.7826 Transcript_4187/m.7826 type:complete len:298 (-) Transcript_4187:440-1333(-)